MEVFKLINDWEDFFFFLDFFFPEDIWLSCLYMPFDLCLIFF